MKKISLKNLNLKEVEQLSREQLKDVLGGATAATRTGVVCNVRCESHSDCPSDCNVCTNYGGSSGYCTKWS